MKICVILIVLFLTIYPSAKGHGKVENLELDWPAEYKWKIVKQQDEAGRQITLVIPENEKVETASIIGCAVTHTGLKYPDLEGVMKLYRERLDAGSELTVIDRADKIETPWVIFKVENIFTDKCHDSESGLYFIMQGRFATYENFVVIKSDTLTSEFVKKWTKVFNGAKLTME